MPIYGEAKRRTMVRSILPSKYRKSAKDNFAIIKRSHRRTVRQIASEQVRYRYCDDVQFDTPDYPDAEIQEAMWTRRNGDKDSAIMRWGPTVVEDVRVEDKLSKLRTIFPDNLSGRHAISHLRYAEGMLPEDDPRFWRYTPLAEREAKYKAREDTEKEAIRMDLYEVIASGYHRRFNMKMRAAFNVPVLPLRWGAKRKILDYRPLAGISDIDNYVDYIYGTYVKDGVVNAINEFLYPQT